MGVPEEIKAGIRKATIAMKIFPVICGSAFKNKGVQTMLDAVVDYLPSPLDIPRCRRHRGRRQERKLTRKASDDEPFSALVFKIMTDPYSGQLAFFRVYSGKMNAGESIYNVAKGRKERVGRLLRMHANKREDIQEIMAGDICAAVGLKTVSTGDTICDEEHPIALESIDFPTPVIQLAVEPKTKADQEKMGMAIAKLAQEDPTFRVNTDPETGQTILSGMGELHLEIIVDRMMREFGVEANVGKPQVAYRETIRATAEYDYTHKKQTGGSGQYARTKLRVEPIPGEGFEFENEIKGGNIPKEFIPAIEKGVVEALEGGILAGYPMEDVKVTVFDGAYHDVDSSEMAFKICSFDLRQGSLPQSEAGAARAGDGGGSGGAGRVYGTGERRSDFPARPARRHGNSGHDADHQGQRSAERNVRLCDRAAFAHAGPRQFHDALRAVRRSAEEHRGRDRERGCRARLRSRQIQRFEQEIGGKWRKKNLTAASRTSTSARSGTSITARRR